MSTPTLTRTTQHSGYAAPTVDRHTGGVWSQTLDHREQLCRLVVDTRHPDQPFYLHAKAALRLNTEKPMGRLHARVCPTWRWATATDLDHHTH
ncbi:hypothetical protein GIY23_18255 [Allosaccharopolyspora coralli]|uniref:Uncharacterized protein n=1 Tax=Allosaccharopolyspora coralli TaxID=2665642 RepID=A0A5Q3QDD9_9PSEU|nr:hypothetical protein [Allosaccharopolyspora coralli]QGK71204.1 hypothetical protein GIY23_18255 [Allosaccharopolyspora coralli]